MPGSLAGLATSMEVALRSEPIHFEAVGEALFFRVLQARPEAKKMVSVAHELLQRSRVHVQPLLVQSFDADNRRVALCIAQQPAMAVNLKLMCSAGDLKTISRWSVAREHATPMLPEDVRMRFSTHGNTHFPISSLHPAFPSRNRELAGAVLPLSWESDKEGAWLSRLGLCLF
jgi:hypothetical protein